MSVYYNLCSILWQVHTQCIAIHHLVTGAHTMYHNSASCDRCTHNVLQFSNLWQVHTQCIIIQHLVTSANSVYYKIQFSILSQVLTHCITNQHLVGMFPSKFPFTGQKVLLFLITIQHLLIGAHKVYYISEYTFFLWQCVHSVLHFIILWQVHTQCTTLQHLVTGVHTVYYLSASCDRCTNMY